MHVPDASFDRLIGFDFAHSKTPAVLGRPNFAVLHAQTSRSLIQPGSTPWSYIVTDPQLLQKSDSIFTRQ